MIRNASVRQAALSTVSETKLLTKSIMRRSTYLATLFAFCSLPVFAQSSNTVTIQFGDSDGDQITGELIEVTDLDIQLQTVAGTFTIPRAGTTCIGAACPGIAEQDVAEQNVRDKPLVILSARDGSSQLMGNLLEIVNGQYVLATEAGELRLNISDVNCAGEACVEAPVAFEFGGPVALVSGTTSVEGTLTGLDDNSYFLEVDTLGTLRVSRDFVCSGDGCPPTS